MLALVGRLCVGRRVAGTCCCQCGHAGLFEFFTPFHPAGHLGIVWIAFDFQLLVVGFSKNSEGLYGGERQSRNRVKVFGTLPVRGDKHFDYLAFIGTNYQTNLVIGQKFFAGGVTLARLKLASITLSFEKVIKVRSQHCFVSFLADTNDLSSSVLTSISSTLMPFVSLGTTSSTKGIAVERYRIIGPVLAFLIGRVFFFSSSNW